MKTKLKHNGPVLLTGGSGFIGRALTRRLVESGCEVLAPPRQQMDVADWDQVETYFRKRRPEVVFHLAASVKGRRGPDDFLEVFRSNTAGTVHILEASRRYEVQRLLVTGTADESGAVEQDGVRSPTQPKQPRSVYAACKAAATLFCESVSRFSELRPTVCRLFAVYGPGQNEDFLLGQLLQAARSGEVVAMTGGHQVRDFVWLEDVVECLVRLANCEESQGQTVDLCSGQTHSLRELVASLEGLCEGRTLASFGEMAYRPGEPFTIAGDPQPLLKLIGPVEFKPLHQGLSELLKSCSPSSS